ncbi:MAG: alpha/beta hydrolase [Desulfobacteraceae bacterium]|nr:alpha/beta hydrolase [Desulfobacteraceae bacterium]
MENFQHSLFDYLAVQGSDVSESQIIVLILPALGAPTRLYKRLYDGIIQADISVALMTLRGEGLLRKEQLVSKGNFGYVELLKDIDNVIEFLTDKYPNKSIVTMGHSLGGQLGCLYHCHNNSKVTASVVIAGGNVGYRSWTGMSRVKTFFATQFIGLISMLLGWFPGGKIGFGGNQPKNTMIDWSRNARTGAYKLINQKIDYETASKDVRSLFLGIVIENDFFAPYTSTKSLLDKFSASDTEIHTVKANSFKEVTPDHFSWLKEPQPAINTFITWLYEKGLSRADLSDHNSFSYQR